MFRNPSRRLLLGLCAAVVLGTAVCTGQRPYRSTEPASRFPSRGLRGAVAGGSEWATMAGMRLFQSGGNAVDAGTAAMFAASVTEFSHFGFGGEAPILIRTKDGAVKSIAGVGTMPKLGTAQLFRTRPLQRGEVQKLEPNGLRNYVPVAGIMPALVPGMVDAGLLSIREYGVKSFAEVIAPSIELADGMAIDEMRAGMIGRSVRFLQLWPDASRVFLPDGRAPRHGEIFRQPDLARTLRGMVEIEKRALARGASRVAAIDAVRDHFYRGEIARKIGTFSEKNGGLLRYEDMAAFRLQVEEPLSTTYRGHTVYKPGFWSQGPALLQALNILEGYDLRALGHNGPEYLHRITEALKLAYADRDTYYGDPLFAKVPADKLLSKEYAVQRRAVIAERASQVFVPGPLGGQHPSRSDISRARIDDALMAKDTTCVNAVDASGMMFSATPSGAWLPSVIAGDTGIPLTQRAQSFLLVEGHPNVLAPGKRPRVTLSPTLVTTADGKPALVLSTPGGDNQDQALLQLLLNVVEFGMNAQQAAEAPRVQTRHLVSSFDNHAMNPGDLLVDDRIPAGTIAALQERGHRTEPRTKWGSGAAPVIVRMLPGGVIEAGTDPYGYRVSAAW